MAETTPLTAQDQFLFEIYRESGLQVANNNLARNTFLSFYMVALAAFIGLLAQSKPVPVDSTWIWWFPLGLSTLGALFVGSTTLYIQRALDRQRAISHRFVSTQILIEIVAVNDFETGPWNRLMRRPPWPIGSLWWIGNRVEVRQRRGFLAWALFLAGILILRFLITAREKRGTVST